MKKNFPPPPSLPCTGVETHAHLTASWFNDEDLPGVLSRATEAGVRHIGNVFLHPDTYKEERDRFAQFPGIFFLLGIHPTEAFLHSPEVEADILECIRKDTRIRCIGEIGLDYYWKEVAPELQKKVFIALLRLAKQCDLPVAIHCRDALDDTLAILEAEEFIQRPLLWHCFGGDVALACKLVDYGWHISVPGTVTYPANTALREAVAAIPLDRLMVETDCPFLSPVPLRGKRNEPANLPYTIAAMAQARGMAVQDLWTECGKNATRFFGLV